MTAVTTVRQFLAGLRVLLALTVLVGVAYPLLITGIGQIAFPGQANGSLVRVGGRDVGSSLIGQQFAGSQWFHPRPSAAGDGYDTTASGGTNLGPSSRRLASHVDTARAEAARADGVAPAAVPPDAVTSSASGLDPHVSPAYAYQQVDRVAQARGVDPALVRRLVEEHVQGRVFGILGEPRVNLLELNLALVQVRPSEG